MIDTKALRQKILDMAIKGELVPQDPTDEPASVLLERIRAEKQRLIKEGKIKKDKLDSVIFKGDDNRHYENLPNGWVVCSLSTIANIFNGDSINEQEKHQKYFGRTEGYNYIGTKDVNYDHSINYENGIKIPYITNLKIAHKGAPLLCIEGGNAGKKIGKLNEDVCFGNKLCAFENYGINSQYLFYFLQSSDFIKIFRQNTQGIIGGVSINTIKALPFRLPPLNEQERIAKNVDLLLSQIDIIEQNQTGIETLYDELKKRTLDLAIQGKLVPQDENDEPASVLLEKIRAEKKAKLGKKYVDSYIYKGDDNCYYEHFDGINEDKAIEVPFELPNNWAWAKLLDIGVFSSGKTPDMSIPEYWVNGNVQWFTSKDMKVKYLTNSQMKITDLAAQSMTIYPTGTLLWVVRSGILTRCLPLCILMLPSTINQDIKAYQLYNRQMSDYVYFMLKGFEQTILEKYVKKITTVHSLKFDELIKKFLVPIPPLAEQQHIVDRINEIFAKL